MDTTTYRGRSLEELLPKIRAELGPDAIVLRRREGLAGGVGGFFQRPFVEVEARQALPDEVELEARNDRATAEGLASPAIQALVEQATPFADALAHASAQTIMRAAATGAADPGRDLAHREREAALGDWIAAGLRRLAPGGRLVMIQRTERLGEMLAGLTGRAGDIEVLPLAPRAGRPAGRVLVRARKGRRGGLELWPPFTLHEGEAHIRDAESYTAAARALLRDAAELLLHARTGGTE
jgi:hypothetical protein